MKRRVVAAWPAAWRGPLRICPCGDGSAEVVGRNFCGHANRCGRCGRACASSVRTTSRGSTCSSADRRREKRPSVVHATRCARQRAGSGARRVSDGEEAPSGGAASPPLPENPPAPAPSAGRGASWRKCRGSLWRRGASGLAERRAAPRSGVTPWPRLQAAIARHHPSRQFPSVIHGPPPRIAKWGAAVLPDPVIVSGEVPRRACARLTRRLRAHAPPLAPLRRHVHSLPPSAFTCHRAPRTRAPVPLPPVPPPPVSPDDARGARAARRRGARGELDVARRNRRPRRRRRRPPASPAALADSRPPPAASRNLLLPANTCGSISPRGDMEHHISAGIFLAEASR